MECSEAAEYLRYTPQRVVLFIQFLFCFSSIIVNLLFVKYCRKNVFFHKNCRILLWTIILINIAHSFFNGTMQGIRLFKIYTANNPCDVMVPTAFCYALRMPSTVCFCACTTVQLSIVIERAIAVRYLSTYENSTPITGFALAIFSIIAALGIATYTLRNYPFTEETFYCSGTTKQTISEIAMASYAIVALEAVVTLMFGGVYYLTLKKSNIYDIRSKYQAKENLTVIRLLIPLACFHFVVFTFFMLANGISTSIQHLFPSESAYRAYIAGVYIAPIYTLGSPFLMWWILKRHRMSRSQDLARMSSKIKDQNDIYFNNYAWNTR